MRKNCSSEEEHEIHNWGAEEKFVTEEHETLKKISREKFVSEEHEIIYMHSFWASNQFHQHNTWMLVCDTILTRN